MKKNLLIVALIALIGAVNIRAIEEEENEDFGIASLFEEEEIPTMTSPAKPIAKMTSKEIGALKYETLSTEQQEQLFEIALFSGLEAHRSAARNVIDAYRANKNMEKLQWDKQLADILAG